MRIIVQSGQFKRDFRKAYKQRRNLDMFEAVAALLMEGKHPPRQFRPHKLQGLYVGYWECHLAPDFLLIYKIESDAVYLIRLGSHSDLFE